MTSSDASLETRFRQSRSAINDHGRVLFDISTSMRWAGPPVGIVRVERELALWADRNVTDVVFVFFDPALLAYREIRCDARLFLTGEATLNTVGLTNPAAPGKRRSDRIPPALKPAFLWLTQSRQMALGLLERLRLSGGPSWLTRLAGYLQRPLTSRKYQPFMVRADGKRRPYLPYAMVAGERVAFRPTDTLICAGSGWGHTNIEAVSQQKSRIGFRFVLLCYDLIPLLFPQFYRPHDVERFGAYMRVAFAIADRVVVTSRRTEADCQAYFIDHGIVAGDIVVAPLGFDAQPQQVKPRPDLPPGLARDHFILLVSTIEPRKGHRLMYRVWRRLMAEGVPQSADFKLVFVGRQGWMTDDLLSEIREDSELAGRIRIVTDADDDLLGALYEAAAFCVYPSAYEGYGLPVVEAFSFGKAVLASNGGALPEVVGKLSPCLDPTDEEAWYAHMRQWIEVPESRLTFERAIRAQFRHPAWADAAAGLGAAMGIGDTAS